MTSADDLISLYDALSGRIAPEARAGWKIGATNANAQRMLGADGPLYAYLLHERLFDAEGGVRLPDGLDTVLLEPEICYEMAAAEAPFANPAGLIRRAWAAVELLDAPGATLQGQTVPSLLQSNIVHFGLVRSAAFHFPAGKVTVDLPVRLLVDGEEKASGTPANVLGHPEQALEWLLTGSEQSPRAIADGALVTTGSCTPVVPARRGQTVSVAFGDLGVLEFKLV